MRRSNNSEDIVKTYIEIAALYGIRDKQTALNYCDSAWQIANTISNNKEGLQSYTLSVYAGIYRAHNDTINYLKKIKEAEYLARKADDEVYLGLVYHQQALYEYYKYDYAENTFVLFLKSIDLLEGSAYSDVCIVQYYILSSIFESLADYDASLAYAKKARKYSKTIDHICRNNHSMAKAYFNLANGDPKANWHFLDSCLYLSYQNKKIFENRREAFKDNILPLRVYVDLANVYMHYEAKINDDSAKYYLSLARNEAKKINNALGIASTSTMLSSYAIDENNLIEAEQLLHDAERAYSESLISDLSVKANMFQGFAKLHQHQGLLQKALEDYRDYYELKDSLYNVQALSTIKNTETKYKLHKKEQEIKLLEEDEAMRKRIIFLVTILSVVSVLSSVVLYGSTFYKKRYFIEQNKILAQQAENERLQKEDAEHAVLLQAMESERLSLEWKMEVDQKEQTYRKLMTSVLHLEEKNRILIQLREIIINSSIGIGVDSDAKNERSILKLVEENLDVDDDFERFRKNFELLYPDFFNRLINSAKEKLSSLDLKYCAYIYMGLSAKEISNLLNIDPGSVRTARYRLKQKFNLEKEVDFVQFINAHALN